MSRVQDSLDDTIVAAATPPGEGAVAIVRLAGPRARKVAAKLAPRRGESPPHLLRRAVVLGPRGVLDEALVVEMHAPNSYTGDDVVELHLHGSCAVVESVIELCVGEGARLAQPGEFTLRAFLRGKLDLAQAEAVADLIAARSEKQAEVAADHLHGGLSREIEKLQHALEGVLAEWRAALDFPEHDSGDGLRAVHASKIEEAACKIQALLENARTGLRGGLRVVLCGAPNVGKSTLLNAWAGAERVLVDAAPGTTRDPVEVELGDEGARWVACDTAGIREVAGVEGRGVEMAREWARRADVALWLLAAEAPVWPEAGLEVQVVGGKADLASPERRERLENEATERGLVFLGWVSGVSGEGVGELRRRVVGRLAGSGRAGVAVVVRERQVDLLRRAHEALERAAGALGAGMTLDVLTSEVEAAARSLGEIAGRDVDAAVLERIFAEFCIGK